MWGVQNLGSVFAATGGRDEGVGPVENHHLASWCLERDKLNKTLGELLFPSNTPMLPIDWNGGALLPGPDPTNQRQVRSFHWREVTRPPKTRMRMASSYCFPFLFGLFSSRTSGFPLEFPLENPPCFFWSDS